MTTREAYIFGWVYGRLEKTLDFTYDQGKGKVTAAAMRPYSGFAAIHQAAIRANVLTREVQADIGAALCEITFVDDPTGHASEAVQPLPIQGSWQLGRYKGLSGDPLPPPEGNFDIKAKRQAKDMTQAELAEAMGLHQAVISRWETGQVRPNAENLKRLMDILS